jgi:fumarate reductase subunit C
MKFTSKIEKVFLITSWPTSLGQFMTLSTTALQGAVGRRSRWPAKLDFAQVLTGLVLVLFVWCHMLLDASILISKDAMYRVSRFMEGDYLFGADYPILVAIAAGVVLAIFVVHALLALRKFPAKYAEYRAFKSHMARFHHEDTMLWWLQAWTGFSLFFLGSVHLIGVMTHPADIGPYASSDRIIGESMWTVYALLLIAVHLHAGLGIYRLAVKWGFRLGHDADASRRRLQLARWIIIAFFLVLGFASLGIYMTIGIAHRGHHDERYVPSWERSEMPSGDRRSPWAASSPGLPTGA